MWLSTPLFRCFGCMLSFLWQQLSKMALLDVHEITVISFDDPMYPLRVCFQGINSVLNSRKEGELDTEFTWTYIIKTEAFVIEALSYLFSRMSVFLQLRMHISVFSWWNFVYEESSSCVNGQLWLHAIITYKRRKWKKKAEDSGRSRKKQFLRE